MCGICGMVSMGGLPADSRTVLQVMAGSMAHRGPDDSGFFVDHFAALGFRRLSIIDLSTGKQPIANEDGRYQLIFNGEIYNFKQLRRELQAGGHRFRSQTDSEVIVHLYEDLGERCVHHLRGMFGFAVWDTAARRLFLARDRFGIKPLYYTRVGDNLIFASEAKAILAHPAVETRLNLGALPHYLTFQYFPDPETAFDGIYRLRPAHHLTLDAGGARIKKYWQLRFKTDPKPLRDLIEMTDHLLQESVRLHMISDVPRGAFLSSGIDSSNIVAMLNRLEDVHTYSVGCVGGKYDELPAARETARFLGTRHREISVEAGEFWNELPRILWCQDEPVADPAAVALYFVARLAAEDVKVVLSGEGADEVFGGYEIYREPAAVAPVQFLPGPLQQLLRGGAARLPAGVRGRNYLKRATTPLEQRYFGNAFIFSEPEKKALLNPELYAAGWADPTTITEPYFKASRGYDGTTRMQHLDFFTWLPGDILAKADRMTMAHSLELRVPYLDHILVEFAAAIPPQYKIHKGMTKYVLRQAASRYLPGEVYRRPKLGFPVPIAAWIREHYQSNLNDLFHSSAACAYFNTTLLEQMLEQHTRGNADYGRKLWAVAVFLLWHRIYLENSRTPAKG
ncbi:MAG: asparagine synthase (glutamine-hydrolyzing) [Bacillota bacterium]